MLNLRISLFFRPWLVAAVICLVYCFSVIAYNDNDPLALVTIGTRFSEGIAEEDGGTEGYDGQFVYEIARNPDTAADFITRGGDVPSYRFQRILLPALAMVFSFGQDALIPWVLLLINVIALASGTALLEYMLTQRQLSRWYALGYALSLGVLGAARLSLPEPLAYALVLGAIVLADRQHWVWSAVLFGLAALAKEVTLVFVAAYGIHFLITRQWRELMLFVVIVGVPFWGWQLILYQKLGAFGVGSGGALATSFEIIPFWGVFRILFDGGVVVSGLFMLILGPFVILPTVWGLRWCWLEIKTNNYTLPVLFLLMNAGVMLFVPFSTYREIYGILRFIVGLQIAVILFAAEKRSKRALLNSTIWFVTMLFLIGADFSGGV